MPFDFKKEYREFYMPKSEPEIVNVPKANYIAVRGKGDPNEEGGAYRQAIGILYAVAYTLKMSHKTDYRIEGFYDYVVPPLEGFWWQEGVDGIDYGDKSAFCWISVIRLPDFITKKDFNWAVETATKKKKLDCSKAEFLTIDEGLCVQIMHVGPFDNEPEAVEIMNRYAAENGYEIDFSDTRIHHEIYLSDARKTAPEKWKTVIRHPVRQPSFHDRGARKEKTANEEMTANMIAWAKGKLGSPDYAGWCLDFIEDALEMSNGIEIFGGDSAKESCEIYRDALRTGIPERGAFVFYDCLCPSKNGPVNWGHCGISLGDGQIIHAWDVVRIDGYTEIERLTALTGDHPKYLGWVPLERVLAQKPD